MIVLSTQWHVYLEVDKHVHNVVLDHYAISDSYTAYLLKRYFGNKNLTSFVLCIKKLYVLLADVAMNVRLGCVHCLPLDHIIIC